MTRVPAMEPSGVWESSSLATPGQVERAKPILRDALAAGRTEVWVGLIEWKFSRFVEPPSRSMKCGHPLAAREIHVIEGGRNKGKMVTRCWACEVARTTRR